MDLSWEISRGVGPAYDKKVKGCQHFLSAVQPPRANTFCSGIGFVDEAKPELAYGELVL